MAPPRDVHEFISQLQRAGHLLRIDAPVECRLEMSEIAQRQARLASPEGSSGAPRTDRAHGGLGGKALLFQNVRGFDMPVLMNAFGSYARICLALGCESLEAMSQRLSAMLQPPAAQGLGRKLKLMGKLMELASSQPRRVKGGPCQEIVQTETADLTALPVIQCWPDDGAGHPAGEVARRYVTLGAVVCKDPHTGAQNAGMYRVQLFGPRQAGMHLHPNHDGAAIWRAWQQRGQDMPAAIVLGGPPAYVYASTAPCPPGIDEASFAALLSGQRIDVVGCRTVELDVPATAEIVIEGRVSVSQVQIEGPFGDHTGFYSPAEPLPVFNVTAITRRAEAIYPATVVGCPPMEDYYFGKATERIFLPLLRVICPEIVDYDLPLAGAFHNFAFVAIRKGYADQARKVMHAIWGAGQLAACKFVIVVDADVDVHEVDAVLFAIGSHVDPARDLETAFGPADILDHAAIRRGSGGKLGIDATRKIAGEPDVRPYPSPLVMPPEIRQLVDRRWREYGLE